MFIVGGKVVSNIIRLILVCSLVLLTSANIVYIVGEAGFIHIIGIWSLNGRHTN